MGLLIDTDDFSNGKYKVSQTVYSDLAYYIARYEKNYLCELLGAELTDLFIADLTAQVPTTAKYLSLFNPFREDDGDRMRVSMGMKDMLMGFIWFEYTRDLFAKASINGVTKNIGESSDLLSFPESYLHQAYNEAVITYINIQWLIEENSSDYPTYNGQCKTISAWCL